MSSDISIVARLKDEVSGKLDIIRDNFDRLGGSQGVMAMGAGFKMNVASMMANEFVGYARQVVAFGQEAVAKASDLGETVSKVENLFGDNALTIKSWAETAATSFGQSKKQAMDAATQFAGMFSSVGVAMNQATQQSQRMVELGADLASFFNTDMADALQALRSGLGGEAEALRRYNVFLSDSAVQQKLFEMGQKRVRGQFTESQKVMARYQIILEQTSSAQGDYARTADGLANSQRSIEAQMEDLTAEIGVELLPVAKELAIVMRDEIVPGMKDAVQAMKDWGGAVEFANDKGITLWGFLGLFVDAIGNAADAWARLYTGTEKFSTEVTQTAITAFREGERASLDLGWAANYAADGTVSTAIAAQRAKKEMNQLAASTNISADAFKNLSGAIETWFGIIDANNEPAILRGELAGLVDQLKEERAELRRLEGIKNPTAAQRRDIERTTGRIAELEGEIDKTRIRIGKLDGASLDELKAAFKSLKENGIDTASSAALTLINRMLRLQGLGYTIDPATGKKNKKGWATGGYVPPGAVGQVGEEGQETLVMFPGGGGYVIPNGGGGGGGGGGAPVVVQLNLDGRTVARVVDRHLYYEAARAPRSSYAG